MRFLIIAVLLFTGVPLQAKDIAGVMVQEVVKTDTGAEMILNGAGIRSKFFFDIYIAQLYMEQPSTDVQKIYCNDSGIGMLGRYQLVSIDDLYDQPSTVVETGCGSRPSIQAGPPETVILYCTNGSVTPSTEIATIPKAPVKTI